MFKRYYFTDVYFELRIKTYNKTKYLIREYKYHWLIDQNQNHKIEFKDNESLIYRMTLVTWIDVAVNVPRII